MILEGEYEPSTWTWVNEQVEEYEASGGERANAVPGTNWSIILMTTRGNKTGKLRKSPLMKVEHDGEYVLVASKGGDPNNPGWYHNIKADPTSVTIQDGAEVWLADVREVTGDERAVWWDRAVAVFPPYAEYLEKTDREIPVLIARRPSA